MSDARREIFDRMRHARVPAAEPITRTPAPTFPEEKLEVLRARIEAAGGRLQFADRDELSAWFSASISNSASVAKPAIPAAHVYSTVAGIASRGVGAHAVSDRGAEPQIDKERSPSADPLRELRDLDIAIVEADFAVVENGAAWHRPTTARCRAAALLAQHLIVLVDREALVPSLHQAYERIALTAGEFGWFLCGPSKTADIEQSLVFGAHGPRTMDLVLVSDDREPSAQP